MSPITTNRKTLRNLYGFGELLSSNTKLRKGSRRFLIRGIALAPAKTSGHNVCPMAGFCASMCVLWFAGRTVTRSVRQAALNRTKLFFEDRNTFLGLLQAALDKLVRDSLKQRARPVVRPNAGSDLAWEKLHPEIFDRNPTVTFYDYTKIVNRAKAYAAGKLPQNYHLTYSINERSDMKVVRQLLESGVNCALVVDAAWFPQMGIVGRIPKTYVIDGKRFHVVDGDKHDLRIPELDGRGNIVALRAKGGIAAVLKGVAAGFAHKVKGGRHETHSVTHAAA